MLRSVSYLAGGLAILSVTLSHFTEMGILGWGVGLFGLILLERGTFVFRGLKPRQ